MCPVWSELNLISLSWGHFLSPQNFSWSTCWFFFFNLLKFTAQIKVRFPSQPSSPIVIERVDGSIHWINHYLQGLPWVLKVPTVLTNSIENTYPIQSAIQPFQVLGPGFCLGTVHSFSRGHDRFATLVCLSFLFVVTNSFRVKSCSMCDGHWEMKGIQWEGIMIFFIQLSYTVRIPIFWLVDLYHVTLGFDRTTSLTSISWCNSRGVNSIHHYHYTMALADSKFDDFCLQCIRFE